jgi:voltage-gated potassium channel
MSRFLREPVSVRGAARVIVAVTALIVVLGGVLMRVLDEGEFPNVWLGIWWALQTVTTVGYGDVTPKDPAGRVVAAFVMLEGVALLSIVTAAITSIFVARAQREIAQREMSDVPEAGPAGRALETRFDDLDRRLDGIEAVLRGLDRSSEASSTPDSGGTPSTG